MPKQPLAEVFGFPINNQSPEAIRYRENRLCPFNNKVPNCTKDKKKDPLGVCSINEGDSVAITCPIRFREDWLIAQDAAAFFFQPGDRWERFSEVGLKDGRGRSAGKFDLVLVSYDGKGGIKDFGACEIQSVYIRETNRRPFEFFMADPLNRHHMDWSKEPDYPSPDYRSSSRKRLVPQLISKGRILNAWGKKQAVVIHRGFYNSLPPFHEVDAKEADFVWLVYDLRLDHARNVFRLTKGEAVFTKYESTISQLTTAEVGTDEVFKRHLQKKLDETLNKKSR